MSGEASPRLLERTGPRSVGSFLGFVVTEQFPSHLEYRESDHTVKFSAELTSSTSGKDILLFEDAGPMRWQAPHHDEPIDEGKAHQIFVRVNAALALLGINPAWETFAPTGRTDWPVIHLEVQAMLRHSR